MTRLLNRPLSQKNQNLLQVSHMITAKARPPESRLRFYVEYFAKSAFMYQGK